MENNSEFFLFLYFHFIYIYPVYVSTNQKIEFYSYNYCFQIFLQLLGVDVHSKMNHYDFSRTGWK